ncbi:competence type IV pilus assembly protein ComGB [Halalkalibacter urbisdiaboli]|uniref:competence type IV pilus assembly protein ComGB n=1 Tax=Halalkalibacter urbisdiaboli TaxID=1960589 RepID=UPI000B44CE88|nr:competence type IV pilus assembly protein ComGB [Halalkalibacter urbisdiaboli]
MNVIKFIKKDTNLERYLGTFGQLLEQGYTMDSALDFIKLHVDVPINEKLSIVQSELRNGKGVHEAFSYTNISNDILSFLYFYEQRGEVALGFVHAGYLYEKKEMTKKEIRKVLRYPIVLTWFCVMLLILLHQFIVPHFNALFDTLKTSPPFLTNFVFSFLYYLPYLSISIFVLFILCAFYYLLVIKQWETKRKINILLGIPICKKLTRQVLTYYFSLQFGRLLGAGMSLQYALSIFEQQEYLSFFQLEATRLKKELIEGESLHQVVNEGNYFLKQLVFVIENGERTGNLGGDLQYYSEMLFTEVEESIQKMITLFQPLFFLLMGVAIFILFLTVMLPMFQMIGSLH